MKTQLQTRDFQTRFFAIKDTRLMARVVLDVLQDEGFKVNLSDYNSGVFSGERKVLGDSKSLMRRRAEELNDSFLKAFSNSIFLSIPVEVRETLTVNIVAGPDKIRMRVAFLRDDHQFDDSERCQMFFSKIDKGIFLSRQNL